MKNLYFDNLVYRVETVEYLKRMVGAEHIMVGTDPFDLGDWMAAEKIRDDGVHRRGTCSDDGWQCAKITENPRKPTSIDCVVLFSYFMKRVQSRVWGHSGQAGDS